MSRMVQVQGGLRARYIRIVPLESSEDGGALRVGVYGTSSPHVRKGPAQGAFTRPGTGIASTRGDFASKLDQESYVAYTVTSVPDTKSRMYTVDGTNMLSNDKYTREENRRAKLHRRKAMTEEAREFHNRWIMNHM